MDSDMVETVTEWDSEPFTGGYAGLRDLADRDFTGAVTDGMAWLFMLNGRVVGVFDGTIEDFEEADGTAYAAPHPSLPLLFAMQETGGETRAKYYTEDTPLSEADQTLKSGNFTGYVELSENVLSGDYYVVYQGGKSMSVAFVGNNRTLITGDEAFERADDEVGIYEVKTVDIDVIDIPSPDGASEESAAAGGAAAAGAAPTEAATDEEDAETAADQSGVTFGGSESARSEAAAAEEPAAAEGPTSTETESEPESVTSAEPEREPVSTTEPEPESATGSEVETGAEPAAEPEPEPTPEERAASTSDTTEATEEASAGAVVAEPAEPEAESEAERTEPEPAAEPESGGEAGAKTGAEDDVFAEEEQWRETKTIPALDPSNSVEIETSQGSVAGRAAQSGAAQSGTTNGGTTQDTTDTAAGQSAAGRSQSDRLAEVKSELADLRDQRDRLAEEHGRLRDEREELVAERDRLERERAEAEQRADSLASRVDELESKIDRLESELETARQEAQQAAQAGGQTGGRQLSPEEALTGTNLFVRYQSKSGATLDDAHGGAIDREEVNENLRLEHHTTFDDEDVVVDGEPFESFLTDTIEFGFGRWVVEDLLYEIRETGNRAGLGDLYDAIPNVDRIEFRGKVELTSEEGETQTQRFDVVCRDRMGNPLVVANLNDSREAATESMLSSLIGSATPVAEHDETLSSAFFVTTSFFEPGALETAADATGGGLLRREKRKSFVKLSRKQGYHLCLVETRNGEFHVNVPEL